MPAENYACAHLCYFCNKFLGKLRQKDFLTQQREKMHKRELLAAINTKADVCNFVTMFLDKQEPNEMLKEMAKLLHMLSGDACMSSVFPFEGNPYITRACTAISTKNLQPHIMDKIKEYNKEVVHLLYLSQMHECVNVITCFMLCIISDIDEIHHDNRPAEQAQSIPGSYYPPGGYMFIWFCPKHGHTYGFHLINKAEGHRDPFCSLYKFLEHMPKHIFYDFMCSLSEYALNRAPELFRVTRFKTLSLPCHWPLMWYEFQVW